MRKLKRGILKRQAEKSNTKTKKAFRILWKEYLTVVRKPKPRHRFDSLGSMLNVMSRNKK